MTSSDSTFVIHIVKLVGTNFESNWSKNGLHLPIQLIRLISCWVGSAYPKAFLEGFAFFPLAESLFFEKPVFELGNPMFIMK